ncbi:hypothetical protein PWT90_10309 [Aphanocladium album]|nr:hypothetical protein PWT90_10309 [Aphanocladium album]
MHFTTGTLGALALASSATAANTIFKGKGYGTYYYDIKQRQACGADFNSQNQGSVMCNWSNAKSLNDINSNNLVAMSNLPLKTAEGRAKYCGKRVIVTVNGVKSNIPFFIGDGCERCAHGSDSQWNANGAAGLDFSYSALSQLSPQACQKGHIDISYEIVDETLYHFDTK